MKHKSTSPLRRPALSLHKACAAVAAIAALSVGFSGIALAAEPAVSGASTSPVAPAVQEAEPTCNLDKDTYATCFPDANLAKAVAAAVNKKGKPEDVVKKADVEGVTSLTLDNKKIADMSGLGIFTNLGRLSLSRNEISKIEGLADMPKLTYLSVAYNKLTTVEGLDGNLPRLTQLMLSGNGIHDFTGLNKLDKVMQFSAIEQDIEFPKIEAAPADGKVVVQVPVDVQGNAIEPTTISPADGKFDAASKTVTWNNVHSDAELTVTFVNKFIRVGDTSRGKFTGTVVQQVGNPVVNVTVTFDSKGGSEVAPVTVKRGTAIAQPADPTKDGYVFQGWSAIDGYATTTGNLFDFATPIENDMKLYALWKPDGAPQPGFNGFLAVTGVTKSQYKVGEAFDPSTITVTQYDKNYTMTVLTPDQYEVSGFDSSKDAEITVTVTSKLDKSVKPATLKLTIGNGGSEPAPEPTVESIAVTALPAKTEYKVGEEFDAAGLQVTAALSDKSERVLSAEEYGLSGFDSSKAADKVTVTVTLKADPTKTATFDVTVKEKADPNPDPDKPDPDKPTPDPDKPTPDPDKPDPDKPTPDPDKPTPDPDKPTPDKPTPDEPQTADKTKLNEAIAAAEKLEESKYTAETWKPFAQALVEAKAVAADAEAGQSKVDAALKSLTDAQAALKEVESQGDQPGTDQPGTDQPGEEQPGNKPDGDGQNGGQSQDETPDGSTPEDQPDADDSDGVKDAPKETDQSEKDQPDDSDGGKLGNTGASVVAIAVSAVLLLAAGSVLIIAVRRA